MAGLAKAWATAVAAGVVAMVAGGSAATATSGSEQRAENYCRAHGLRDLWTGEWAYSVDRGDSGRMSLALSADGTTVEGRYQGKSASGGITGVLDNPCGTRWSGRFMDLAGTNSNQGSFQVELDEVRFDGWFKITNGARYTWHGQYIAPPAVTSTRFSMSGYANLARDVPRYQLGQVRLDGSGTLGATLAATTSTRNAYLHYPEATMSTEVIGWEYESSPHRTKQVLRLRVKVTASNDPVDCAVGTEGDIKLVDDNRRMRNGQTRDSITQLYPVSGCPSFVQGVSNRDAAHLQPTNGGPGGGQWADVRIDAQ